MLSQNGCESTSTETRGHPYSGCRMGVKKKAESSVVTAQCVGSAGDVP
jgi:hypothetical protein